MKKSRMNKPLSFHILFFVIYCPLAAIALMLFYFLGNNHLLISFSWGSGFSTVIAYISAISGAKVINKSIPRFLSVVIGGMVLRMILYIAISIIVLKMTDLNLYSFFGGLFGSFIILQVLDMVYLYKNFGKRKEDAS